MRSNEQRLIVCAVLFSTTQLGELGLTIPIYNRDRTHVITDRKEQIPIAFEHDIYHNVGVHALSDERLRTQTHVIFFTRGKQGYYIPWSGLPIDGSEDH